LLWQLPAIDILRRVWLQQFRVVDGHLLWRVENQDELPPSARLINSPYDLEARFSRKRATTWVGYKVHLTETCEDDQPHLITQVATTVSTAADSDTLPQIQQELAATSLLPSQHLVDTAYVSAERIVQSQQIHQVDVVGPARKDQNLSPGTYVSLLVPYDGKRPAPRLYQVLAQAVWALPCSLAVYTHETPGY
jgi:transposase